MSSFRQIDVKTDHGRHTPDLTGGARGDDAAVFQPVAVVGHHTLDYQSEETAQVVALLPLAAPEHEPQAQSQTKCGNTPLASEEAEPEEQVSSELLKLW